MEHVLDRAVALLAERGGLQRGDLIVLGCSTSEIAGGPIGKASAPEIGQRIALAFHEACMRHGFLDAYQCCEHLNRALVMEEATLASRGLERVAAVPKPHAGGSTAAAGWRLLKRPCLTRSVQAEAVVDIGDTLVGMHIRPVAVPVRMDDARIGQARLVMAYSRPPYIGGPRAEYT